MTLLENLFFHFLLVDGNLSGAFERAAEAYEYFQKAAKSVAPAPMIGQKAVWADPDKFGAVVNPTLETLSAVAKKADKSLPAVIPLSLDTPEFRQAWDDWFAYRREAKLSPWKPVTARLKLAELEALGPAAAVEAIRRSIGNGYLGIFPGKRFPAVAAADRTCNRCAGKGTIEVDADLGSRFNSKTGQTERIMRHVPCTRCQGSGKF